MFGHLSSTWKWVAIPFTHFRRRVLSSTKILVTLILLAGSAIALFSPMVIDLGTAHADINNTRSDAFGTLELSGSSWLAGGGVNIYSNGSSAGDHYPIINNSVNGVVSGEEWQCVEMVNRLY